MPAFDNTYEPSKRLTCLCGRTYETERGLKQHIRLANREPDRTSNRDLGHGRCYTATAKLMVQYVAKDAMRTLDFYKNLREQCNTEPKPSSFVKYTSK